MKRLRTTVVALFLTTTFFAQEHFTGLSTSSRSGIINAGTNPAEIMNMPNKFDFNLFGFSVNVANNKVGFKDITSGKNIQDLIFQGSDPVNMRINTEIFGPGLAMKFNNWGIAIYTKATAKLDVIDVDPKLGDAINNANDYSGLATLLNNSNNQRVLGTAWGEVDATLARTIFNTSRFKFSAGITGKALFPSAYANVGISGLQGTVVNVGGTSYLSNASAQVNFAYSGALANDYASFDEFAQKAFGKVGGFAADIGANFQIKGKEEEVTNDEQGTKKPKKRNNYILNAGASVRNIGSMILQDDNNQSTTYGFNTLANTSGDINSLDLSELENLNSIKDVETYLYTNNYLTKQSSNKDFKIQLPTTLNLYADVRIIKRVYVSGFLQQNLNKVGDNTKTSAQNVITITPRFNTGFFEMYVPFSNTSVAGFNTGIGFRVGGFYIGSGSAVSALINDTKQIDAYLGFRWAFL